MVAWFWTPELRPLLKGIDLSAPCCSSFEMMGVWHFCTVVNSRVL